MVADSPDWKIESIHKDHNRESFDCGIDDLSDFIRKFARQNEKFGLGRTFVAVIPNDLRVWGYYTLSAGKVRIQDLPPEETRRFPNYAVPVSHLGRLATDLSVQGKGLGERLLMDALWKSFNSSNTVASFAVEVIADNDSAKRFYLKYGFKPLLDDQLHLYLPMKTVKKLFP